MVGTHLSALAHTCSSHASLHAPRRLQQLACTRSRPRSHHRRCISAATSVKAADGLPECDSGSVSTSGCDADAASKVQSQLLRSCGTGLAVVAALSVLLHSNAASAADTDLGQQRHAVNAVFDLAAGGEEDFWGNVGAYIRFFFTVLLGTANVASQPFRKAAKRPATAIALVVGSAALFAFMAITVKTMLGVGDSDFEYLTRGI